MEETKIIEENKLIAEFMGYKYFPYSKGSVGIPGWKKHENSHLKIGNGYLCRATKDIYYHSSWDWLMKVVEKIEAETAAVFQIFKRQVDIYYEYDKFQLTEEDYLPKEYKIRHDGDYPTKIKAIYAATVDYIRWSNQQKS